MLIYPVNEVCTARHIHALDRWAMRNKPSQLSFLKQNIYLLELCQKTDFAMFFSISTEEQENDESHEKLGFTRAFEAPKTHRTSREKDSGPLTMWCIQPWILEENRLRLIKELEDEGKITPEEIERRKTFEELFLYVISKTDLYKEHFPDNPKLYTKDSFPVSLATRKLFFTLVTELTGGFDPSKDQVVKENLSNLTWGLIKERAHKYRNGEI